MVWRRPLPRVFERRLARTATPGVVDRSDLRACAAIGAGCRQALECDGRGVDPTRAAIVRLGAETAAKLAALPDTPKLAADHQGFIAAHPVAPDCERGPTVRQMRRLVERYRRDCSIDSAFLDLEIAEAMLAVSTLPEQRGEMAPTRDDRANRIATMREFCLIFPSRNRTTEVVGSPLPHTRRRTPHRRPTPATWGAALPHLS